MRSIAMSNSKYFIRGGGRWREIDLETGRVSGWAGTRFVFTKRGKLRVAGRRAVLAGLKNLSQNKPTTVREGLQLPKMKIDHSKCSTTSRTIDEKHPCCACQHTSCNTDADFNNLLKPSTNTVAIQCNGELSLPNSLHKYKQDTSVRRNANHVVTRTTAIRKDTQNVKHSPTIGTLYNDSENFCKELEIDETDIEVFRKFVERDEKNIFNVDLLSYDEDDEYKQKIFYKINPIVKLVRDRNIRKILDKKNKLRLNSEVNSKYRTRKREDKIGIDKVITIDLDTDGSEHRLGAKTTHRTSEPNIKIVEFIEDTDSDGDDLSENTKEIENSKKVIVEKGGESRRNVINIEDRSQGNRVKSSHNDKLVINGYRGGGDKQISGTKDNRDNVESYEITANRRNVEENARSTRILLKPVFVKKVSTNSRSRDKRDFSMLEDEAVVDWILKNDKGHCVKGNKVWKILQPIHSSITGQFRTWQSLRNRYLRYILPSLGSLSLSSAQATALRAAASAGELKTRQLQRRNSIFKTVRVRSAWNARPVQKPRNSDNETSSPSRLLRSNTTIVSPSRNNLPTYSEITRRFAQKHRSTPNSDESEKRDRQTDKQDDRANKISQTDKRDGRKERDKNTDRKNRQLDRQNKLNVNDNKNNNNISDEKRHRLISRQGLNTVRIDTSSERSERPNKRHKIEQHDDVSASKPNAEEKSKQKQRKIKDQHQKYGKERETNNNNEKNVNKAQLNINDIDLQNNNYNRPLTRHSLKNSRFDTDVESDFQSDSKNIRDNIRRRRKSNTDNVMGFEYDTTSEDTRKNQIKTRHSRRSIAIETNAEYKNSEKRKEHSNNNRAEIEHRKRNTRSNKTDTENDTDIESVTESRIKTRQRGKGAVEKINADNDKYSEKNVEKVKSNRSNSRNRDKGRKYETDTEHNSSVDTDLEITAMKRRLRRKNLMKDQIADNFKNSQNKTKNNSKSNRNDKADKEYDSNFDTDIENTSQSPDRTRQRHRSTNNDGTVAKNGKHLENKAKNGQIHKRKRNDTTDTDYDSNNETDVEDSVKNQTNTRKMRMNVRRTTENQSKSDKNSENKKDSSAKSSHKRNNTDRNATNANFPSSERHKSKTDQINSEFDSIEIDKDDTQNRRKRRRIHQNTTDTENDTDFETENFKIQTRKDNRRNETDDSEFTIDKDNEITSAHTTESEDLTDSGVVNKPITRLSAKSDRPEETAQKPRNIRLRKKDPLKSETDRHSRERRISSRINIVFESNSDSDKRRDDETSKSDTEGYSPKRRERRMSMHSRNGGKEINKTDYVLKDKRDGKITRNLRRLFNPKVAV